MRRIGAGLLAALGSAALYGLAFPPVAYRPLAWVALVPLFVAVRRCGPGDALVLAGVWTFAMAYAVGDCFPRAVSTYYDQPFVVGIGFFVGVSSLLMAVYYLPFAAFYRTLGTALRPWSPLLVGAAWVTAELARVRGLVGHPWALLGYSQTGVLPLVQVAEVSGVYGVSFLVAAANAALAELWLTARARGPGRAAATRGLVLVAFVVAGSLAYGALRLAALPAPVTTFPVAVVQTNLDLGAQWEPAMYGRNLAAHLALTKQALRARAPALVVWPENAMTFFLDHEPRYRERIADVLGSRGAQLLAGGPYADGDGERRRYYNAAFLLSPAGDIVARYDKQQLLPFAEYFPFRRLTALQRRFAGVREFTPGRPTPPLPTAVGLAGVVICNEVMFPDIVSARVRAGAVYLVNLANDTWLGDRKYSLKMLDISTWRAIEQRRMLVRASTSGPSAIVDAAGRTLVRTEPFTAGTIGGAVGTNTVITPYCRVGDAFAFGCAAAVAGAVLARARARWRRPGP